MSALPVASSVSVQNRKVGSVGLSKGLSFSESGAQPPMPLLSWLARQLSSDRDKGPSRQQGSQEQQRYPPPMLVPASPLQCPAAAPAQHLFVQPPQCPLETSAQDPQHPPECLALSKQEAARQRRQQERDAAKAAGKAAAAGQPKQRPPRGPCGRQCDPPSGGTTLALPLASAVAKGRPPWNTQRLSDLSLVHLWDGGVDALRVSYPAGSGTPSSNLRGGVQLSGAPPLLPARDCLLRFDFRTAPDFDWTRGGKLGGGLLVGRGAAAGYRHSPTAASARVTWGPDGSIMHYAYQMEGTQQAPEYSQVAKLGGGCGDHLFPNTFQAQRGVWNSVVLRVRLNTPGRADGVAGLGLNGAYREYDSMVWRLGPQTQITEAMLVTFFGGSWCTPIDTFIDFANFSLTVLE